MTSVLCVVAVVLSVNLRMLGLGRLGQRSAQRARKVRRRYGKPKVWKMFGFCGLIWAMSESLRKKFIGDRAFYAMVLAVAVPIMIQNGFTNFVSMLDNIMVGRLGTEQMSGVAIANQLIFIYNLCIWGGLSGAGIFTAQFYGKDDVEGVRNTFRFKLIFALAITVLAVVVLNVFGESLIGLYLYSSEDGGDLALAMESGLEYVEVISSICLLPFLLVQVYSSTLRECGETVLPMKAGVAAVLVNLVFNYFLIYGKFGFPALGVRGAAIATGISRYVEAAIVLIWTHRHTKEQPFAVGLYRTLKVPKALTKGIVKKGFPLLLNETLWSSGMALLVQCYSTRGLNAVAGVNIAETINNVFKVVFLAFGASVGIIIGRLLGAGKMEEAKDTDRKIIVFSIFVSAILGVFMAAIAPGFPKIYNTTEAARHIATILILAQAACLPIGAFKNATYYTLRSGGRTFITFLFDGGFVWAVSLPTAFILSRFTDFSVLAIFLCVQLGDLLKSVFGYYLVKKGVWLRNIVTN